MLALRFRRVCIRRLRTIGKRITALGVLIAAQLSAAALDETSAVILPLPAVKAFAHDHRLELGRFAPQVVGIAARAGDSVTTLVSLRERSRDQQWLVLFQIADLTDAERAAKPPPDMFISAHGRPTLQFSNLHRFALEIQTI